MSHFKFLIFRTPDVDSMIVLIG